jgi:hypothetical protein
MIDPRDDARVRTPSSGVLVQLLFIVSVVGTGVVAGLVTWLAPKVEPKDADRKPRDE